MFKLELSHNFPNPFNPSTNIEFQLPTSSNVKIVIFNQIDQIIRNLIDQFMPNGPQIVEWNGKNEQRIFVSSGVYFYTKK